MYDVLTVLFTKCGKGKKLMELRFIRPDDDDLKKYVTFAKAFFEALAQHFPPIEQYFDASAENAPAVVSQWRTRKGGHILFRPVGLRLFAELTAELIKEEGFTLQKAIRLFKKLPTDFSAAPYWRVDPSERPNESGREGPM